MDRDCLDHHAYCANRDVETAYAALPVTCQRLIRYAHELDLPGLHCWPLKRYPYLVFYVAARRPIDVARLRTL
ncbi:hypothetical protein P4050_21615 [Pseudomonas aeruginosa]|nr:hypothetical protein [Pseudomonas aeruginosa]